MSIAIFTNFGYTTQDGELTPLMIAARNNNGQLVEQFICQAGIKDKLGKTALMYAVHAQSYSSIDILKLQENKIFDNYNQTALDHAIEYGFNEVIEHLKA
ncbi:Kinase [Hexamita inflata]|uniref:Kinase n=1 Tax=Hexamita inflata TaxID=28002 RepID=A0AA86U6V1_9EUKA|nr:Kinase [Hexamita inflata]